MKNIIKISNKYNLHIVEDAAQAIGSSIMEKKVDHLANLDVFLHIH